MGNQIIMSTTQTDAFWDYQEQAKHAFLMLASEDMEVARQWILDATGDNRVAEKTIAWCKAYLTDYEMEFKSWSEDELIKNKQK